VKVVKLCTRPWHWQKRSPLAQHLGPPSNASGTSTILLHPHDLVVASSIFGHTKYICLTIQSPHLSLLLLDDGKWLKTFEFKRSNFDHHPFWRYQFSDKPLCLTDNQAHNKFFLFQQRGKICFITWYRNALFFSVCEQIRARSAHKICARTFETCRSSDVYNYMILFIIIGHRSNKIKILLDIDDFFSFFL
jgi:hypothetical protein